MTKIPTDAEFRSFDGAQCSRLWRRCGSDWRCPACGRSKFEIIRWTRRAARPPERPIAFFGWWAGLYVHHDHSADIGGFYRPLSARFEETVICDQCNAADGLVKRILKLPSSFSFSAAEIKQFVTPTPHASHQIDVDRAYRLFREVHRECA
jgi:hypothetical protein